MNVIYSNTKIEGLKGVYANPSLFNGDTEVCSVAYTDDVLIKEAYENKGIEVKSISKQNTTSKKVTKK